MEASERRVCVYVLAVPALPHTHFCSQLQPCQTVLSSCRSLSSASCVAVRHGLPQSRCYLALVQGAREAVRHRGGGVSERGREAAATGLGALVRGAGAQCGGDDRAIGGAGVLQSFGGDVDFFFFRLLKLTFFMLSLAI